MIIIMVRKTKANVRGGEFFRREKKKKEFQWINKSITWKTIESERREREMGIAGSRRATAFSFGTATRSVSKRDGSSAPELFAC